jgi:hypothetical protein
MRWIRTQETHVPVHEGITSGGKRRRRPGFVQTMPDGRWLLAAGEVGGASLGSSQRRGDRGVKRLLENEEDGGRRGSVATDDGVAGNGKSDRRCHGACGGAGFVSARNTRHCARKLGEALEE